MYGWICRVGFSGQHFSLGPQACCALQFNYCTLSVTQVTDTLPAKGAIVEAQQCSVYGHSTELVPQEELYMEVLDKELSPECYKDRFRTLLYLEEHQRQNYLTKE